MNVLGADRTPRVMSLKAVLTAWIAHQIEVLIRRAQHRLGKIDDRIELLDGYLIAYLNLDRVIEIIRNEDEPKPIMMAEFGLNDRQAEAILNMRLRQLRRLEEFEIKGERDKLAAEREGLVQLIESPARQRTRLKKDLAALREAYGPHTKIGKRRTLVTEAAPAKDVPLEAMIEREPITVIMSQKAWVRAMKGHVALDNPEALKFKEGDGPSYAFHAQTTDKILLAGDDGRFYTLGADKLPGGRGFGEPVRLMIDLPENVGIMALFAARVSEKLLLASSDGRGFIAKVEDVIAEICAQGLSSRSSGASRHQMIISRPWATTASSSSSRLPKCQKWGAAKVSRCNATKMVGWPMRRASASRRASAGQWAETQAARERKPIFHSGASHGGPQAGCRRWASQGIINLGECG
jgi:topoisomerase IV subunit A